MKIFFDLETTGVDVLKSLPVQLAFTVYNERGEATATRELYIKLPQYPEDYYRAQRVHGISKDFLRNNGISPSYVARIWNNTVWDAQPVELFGYNIINYDLPILQRFLLLFGKGKFKLPPITKVHDVLFMVRDFLGIRKWPKQRDAADRLKIEYDEDRLHNALYDIELCYKIYRELERKGGGNGKA